MKKNKKSSGFAVIATLFLLLFIAELFFCTWCRVECRDLNYEIRRQEAERERLLKDQNRLNVEIERLKSPERIGRIAREKLGLRPPSSEQVIVLP